MDNIQLEHSQHTLKTALYPLCLLVHDIEDPTNIGSLFRIADALAVEKIYLTGKSPSPPNSKIKKTSRSTEKYVCHSSIEDPLVVIEQLRSEGYSIVSLEITSKSIDIRRMDVDSSEKICLILGSEKTGVCQELLDMSDQTVHIPMLGANSSMNVAVACSIAVFELTGKLSTR